jgi:hypothetical protein
MDNDFEIITTTVTAKIKFVTIMCVLDLPDDIRDKMPRKQIAKSTGRVLLNFRYVPRKGDLFPYASVLWKVSHDVIQIPAKYKSRQPRYPAMIFPEYYCQYETLEEAIQIMRNYENE